MINLAFVLTAVIGLIAASAVTPWQLFQSLCPFVSAQSPQCLRGALQQQVPQQQQIPQQQQVPQQQQIPQQLPLCPDGSQPDVNGNCPVNQQDTK